MPLHEHLADPLKLLIFFLDILPKAVIFTYVFYTNSRSTLAAILLHFMINFTGSIIEIEVLTEFIQMLLFFITAGVLVWNNRRIFLQGHEMKQQVPVTRAGTYGERLWKH